MLIDSNIIIYASQQRYDGLSDFLASIPNRSASVVSYIEALGYHRIIESERAFLEEFYRTTEVLPLTNTIADQAISLRQQRRMGLGDAIIAATALVHGLTLVTHNTEDFRWIGGLELMDPVSNLP